VRVTLGEGATEMDFHATATSGAYIYVPACDLSAVKPTWTGVTAGSDGNEVEHTFDYSVSTNKWCSDLVGGISVTPKDDTTGISWTKANIDATSTSVKQNSHHDIRDYIVTIMWNTKT